MSARKLIAALAASALLPIAACSPKIRRPQLLHPGPANVQRNNAEQFDPYPQTDMGPEIVGGRPPDYLVPVPEVERANQFRDSHPAPALPILTPAQPVYLPGPPPAAIPAAPVYSQPSQPPVEYRY